MEFSSLSNRTQQSMEFLLLRMYSTYYSSQQNFSREQPVLLTYICYEESLKKKRQIVLHPIINAHVLFQGNLFQWYRNNYSESIICLVVLVEHLCNVWSKIYSWWGCAKINCVSKSTCKDVKHSIHWPICHLIKVIVKYIKLPPNRFWINDLTSQ